MKNGLFKKFLKTKSIYYHTKFKIYRNKLNHLIKLAKRNYYYNKFFSGHVNNGKQIWYGIKQIVQFKTHINQHVNKIVIDNREIVDKESIANVLNEFFANIGSNLASSIPSVTHTAREFMSSPICDIASLFLSPVTGNGIELEIAKLNASYEAVGPSSIPNVILKILKCELSGPLGTIFNTSFLTGIVPEKFKMPRVYQLLRKVLRQDKIIIDPFLYSLFLINC